MLTETVDPEEFLETWRGPNKAKQAGPGVTHEALWDRQMLKRLGREFLLGETALRSSLL